MQAAGKVLGMGRLGVIVRKGLFDVGSGGRWARTRGRIAPLVAIAVLFAAVPVAGAKEAAFDPNEHPHSIVVDWVDAMLEAIELNPPAPTATTWRMWVTMSSIYDAWSYYDATALSTTSRLEGKAQRAQRTLANKEKALSYAAHHALTYLFPDEQWIFDSVMELHGFRLSDSTDIRRPEGIGNVSARAVIDMRLADGSNAAGGFAQIASSIYPTLYSPTNSADPNSSNSISGPDFDLNHWTPIRVSNGTLLDENGNPTYDDNDPSTFADQKFLTPHWGSVTPFALSSGDQFRPVAPPMYGSDAPYTDALGNVTTNDEAFRNQTAEVLEHSANLDDTAKVIAEFWADGPHTWTPPGHWVQIAIGISLRDGHSVDQVVKMYMALTGALLDSGIAAWEAKRAYDYVRPFHAIRYLYAGQQVMAWAGPNQGIQLIDGSDWTPYQSGTFVTPPFAEYVSGHSTFSRSAAEILTEFTGSSTFYDGATMLGRDYDGDGREDLMGMHRVLPGRMMFEDGPAEPVTLTWNTFYEAADEAGFSRIYGGIHFQDGDRRARAMGAAIGKQAYQWAELYWNPFGKMRSTVVELRASGDLSEWAKNQLLNRLDTAEKVFKQGSESGGCALLASTAALIDRGRGISSDAQLLLGRQVDTVRSLICR